MIYLLKSGDYYKVGYTESEETLKTRLSSYRTHNPNFIFLGYRNGTREDEVRYRNMLGTNRKLEWVLIEDSDNLDSFKLDFKGLGKIASELNLDLCYEEKEFNEMYKSVTVGYSENTIFSEEESEWAKSSLYDFLLADGSLYISNMIEGKYYKTNAENIKTFYKDYEEDGIYYSGIFINDHIIFNKRIRMIKPNMIGIYELGTCYNIKNNQDFKIIEKYLKNYDYSHHDDEEEISEF